MDATPLPKNAIILCRISDARDDDTAGVDDQERRGRELAERLGWGVLRVVVENDVSAFKRRVTKLPNGTTALRTVRPDFRATVEALVSGEADGLIAYDLDRAVRDPRDLEDLIDAVETKKPRSLSSRSQAHSSLPTTLTSPWPGSWSPLPTRHLEIPLAGSPSPGSAWP